MRYGRPLFAIAAMLALWSCSTPEWTDADIVALDALQLQAELAAGRVSAVRVTQAYVRRIAELDDAGPTLGADIEVNPDAESIARGLDDRLRSGATLGPLHGVPVLVKANIDTADALATTAGSLALAEHRAQADADVVTRLRAAGAVLLGKTNLSEWANFRSIKSTSGWSSVGGQTRNPYVLDRNPCGSSSGAAVAVAARLAPLAVGTETDGSIVCPAATNGVVGIKPTIGTVSQRGIVPIAHSQDTAGPLARTVADAALLLAVLAEPGVAAVTRGREPVASPGGEPVAAVAATASGETVAGLRVGVVRDFHGAGQDAAVEAGFSQALGWLAANGVVLVDPVQTALPPTLGEAELTILLAEFRDDLNAYLAGVQRGPRSLDEVIAFNAARAPEVMPHFGQELLLAARDGGGAADASYAAAIRTAADARSAVAKLFAELRLDALVAPTNSRAWRTDYVAGDRSGGVHSANVAAVTGLPNVTVPTVLAKQLPLGVSLIGQPGDEPLLVTLAAAIERERGPFPEPQFLPTTAD